MKILFLNLLFLMFSSFSLGIQASEVKHNFALAIVSPGAGPDMMGHLYAYFGLESGLLQEGVVYEFNMDRDDSILEKDEFGNQDPIKAFLGIKSRMLVQSFLVGTKTLRYRMENRTVFYYFFNLPQEDILSIREELELEKKRREETKIYDYNVLNASCLTEMLEIVNPYLIKNSYPPINYMGASPLQGIEEFLSMGLSFVKNAPMVLAAKLGKHPAIYKVKRTLPQFVEEVDLSMDLYRKIQQMDVACGFDLELVELMEHILLKEEMLFMNATFSLMHSLKKNCQRPDIFKELIFLWYLKSNDIETKIKIETNFPEAFQ